MAIKEIPVTYREYYKSMIQDYTRKKEDALIILEDLEETEAILYKSVKENKYTYKTEFGINLDDYEEFINNKYTSGVFYKLAKGAFLNRKNNYVLVADLYDLLSLAKKQKDIYEINKDVELYTKMLNLKIGEYKDILSAFYSEVQTKMIIKGYGYVFEGMLGWTCINRCHLVKCKQHIDYAATKKKKEELLAEGKRIYNKEEKLWCEARGIPYDAVDARIYRTNEYCYEIPLLNCRLPNGSKYKLFSADYRSRTIRGKSNKDLMIECNYDIEKICKLPIGINTKVTMCVEADKTLYTNFIRNENQKPSNAVPLSWEN